MRKKEKEIREKTAIEDVIRRAQVCHLGLCDNNTPYVVPVCFGYSDGTIYFHCSPEGRKIDLIRKNPLVCFQVEADVAIVRHEKACKWDVRYRSVIGTGKAFLVSDFEQKRQALGLIMHHYNGDATEMSHEATDRAAIVRIDIEEMSGKESGYEWPPLPPLETAG
jgi:nitroimidazol reductase NimA-like FMN-containing flavoprotein (pyridoxamine 5'-phosphate oxidase superfamily)